MAQLPLGCKFTPTDEEIFTYLNNKVNDLKQPNVMLDLVKELDLYHSCPSDHPGLSKEESTYIFATRVAKYGTSKFSVRKTKDGKGYWKIVHTTSKKFQLGKKKTLNYFLKGENIRGKKEKRTDWVMHEYALTPADPKTKVNETMVLCRITTRKQKHEVTDAKQDSDSSPEDGTGRNESRVKLMMSKSSQENQQSTSALANDPQKNTTLTTENDVDLSLRLRTGEQN